MKVFAAGLSVLLGLSLLSACGAADDTTGEDEAAHRRRCGNGRIDRGEQCADQLDGEHARRPWVAARGPSELLEECRFDRGLQRSRPGGGGRAGRRALRRAPARAASEADT